MIGTVKWFSSEKGYGFIVSDTGFDHYFNVRDVRGIEIPREGDQVSFESKSSKKGLRASSVSIHQRATVKPRRQRKDLPARFGRWMTTDHFHTSETIDLLTVGMGPWDKFKTIIQIFLMQMMMLLLVFGAIIGLILYFGKPS